MPVAATVTPQPSLSTARLKYVADVAFLNIDDTAGIVNHALNTANPIVVAVCTVMGTVASSYIVAFTDANNLSITKNTAAANTTATWRFVVLLPHSIVAKPV